MAAWSPDEAPSRSSPAGLSRFLPSTPDEFRLPAGPCNFTDLTVGGGAPRCGCQRFWDKAQPHKDAWRRDSSSWCMCGHHACFHATESNASREGRASDVRTSPARHKTTDGVMTDCVERPGVRHSHTGGVRVASTGLYKPSPLPGHLPRADGRQSTLPDTIGSTQAFSADASVFGLPPIPSQCLISSQSSHNEAAPTVLETSENSERRSVATNSTEADTIPMRNLSRQNLSTSVLRVDSSPRGPPTAEAAIVSATEVATPSVDGTRDAGLEELSPTLREVQNLVTALEDEVSHARGDTGEPQDQVETSTAPPRPSEDTKMSDSKIATGAPSSVVSSLNRLTPHLNSLLSHLNSYPTLVTSLRHHSQRLESLENASFSNGPIDDFNDRYEFMDGRVIELENRVEELDKWHRAAEEDRISNASTVKGSGRDAAKESFTSIASSKMNNSSASVTSSAMIAAAIDRMGSESSLGTFETRLSELEQAVLPSAARPLEIEVVVLPWGPELGGIWAPTPDDGSLTAHAKEHDGWARTRNFLGLSRDAPRKADGWDGAAIRRWANGAEEWMYPKACAPKRKVYERLRSRGLVQTAQVVGGSAHDVQVAIKESFGGLLEMLSSGPSAIRTEASSSPGQTRQYDRDSSLGLQAPVIPLRKIYHEAFLRFLSPNEMVSSALWDVDFLLSSVVMRAAGGQRRLYVTHRDAYLQYNRDQQATWSWERLKHLPPVSDTEGHDEICWQWDPRLDPPVNESSFGFSSGSGKHSSFRPQSRLVQAPEQGTDQLSEDESDSTSVASAQRALPMSPLSEFPLEQQAVYQKAPLQRTASMPLTLPPHAKIKRHVASQEEVSSLPRTAKVRDQLYKRQRVSRSRSPAFEEDPMMRAEGASGFPWTPTPRRSQPPSPFFSEAVPPNTAVSVPSKRGGTPFAYATPHSGTVPARTRRAIAHDDDDDDDDEEDGDTSAPGTEEIDDVSMASGSVEDSAWEGVVDEMDETELGVQQQQQPRGDESNVSNSQSDASSSGSSEDMPDHDSESEPDWQ
ncbi:MAG: hypothetical protein M4579_006262, partial [Chaenotheca gracillima]